MTTNAARLPELLTEATESIAAIRPATRTWLEADTDRAAHVITCAGGEPAIIIGGQAAVEEVARRILAGETEAATSIQ